MFKAYSISVLLPCHSLKFLGKSLESISIQTLEKENFEVVVVADRVNMSELINIVEKFNFNYRIFETMVPGIVAALNLGLSKIESKYVVRMDEDDLMSPVRLANQLKKMECQPRLVAMGGQLELIDEDENSIGRALYPKRISRKPIGILRKSPIAHPASIIRRDAILTIGGYRNFLPEDWDLWVRLREVGEIGNSGDVVLKYRVHPNQLSREKMYAQKMGQRFITSSFFARKFNMRDFPDIGEDPYKWLERTQIQLRKVSSEFNKVEEIFKKDELIESAMEGDSKISRIIGVIMLAKQAPFPVLLFLVKKVLSKRRTC